MRVNICSEVKVPAEPWLGSSRADRSTYQPKLFLDVLYNSCKVVEECRDRMLSAIQWQEQQIMKFRERMDFEFTTEQLIVKLKNGHNETESALFYHKELHLECYGMEAELKDYLENIRRNRPLYSE